MNKITFIVLSICMFVAFGCSSRFISHQPVNSSSVINDNKTVTTRLYSYQELKELSALKVLPQDLPDGFVIGFKQNVPINWTAPLALTNSKYTDGNSLSQKFDLSSNVNTQYKRVSAYLCSKYGLEVKGQCFVSKHNFIWVDLQPNVPVEASVIMKSILTNETSVVTRITHNWKNKVTSFPNDPFITNNPWQWYHKYTEIDKLWDLETGDSSVRVAIIDTGVRKTHKELNDGRVTTFYPPFIADVVDYDSDPNDEDQKLGGHGSGCAGIVGAIANNNYMGSGVAHNVTILPFRCMNANGEGNAYLTSVVVTQATIANADIISMSLGGPGYLPELDDACKAAWDNGIFLVAAGGNEYLEGNPISYPANLPNVMGVGAAWPNDLNNSDINQTWKRCDFSNDHDYIDIAAAGIAMPVIGNGSDDQYHANVAGTSVACPIVAGVAALLKSAKPDFTNQQIWDTIVKKSSTLTGFSEAPNAGRLDCAKIAKYMQSILVFPDVTFINPKENSIIKEGKSFVVSLANSEDLTMVEYLLEGNVIGTTTTYPFDSIISTKELGNRRATIEARCFIDGLPQPKLFKTTIDIVNLYGDTNADNIVDVKDVELVLQNYRKVKTDAEYRGFIDVNLDGIIDERDVTKIGLNYGKKLVLN